MKSTVTIAGLILLAGFVLAGCQPTSGVVTGVAVKPGQPAPDISYVSTTGQKTTFNQVRYRLAVVAFVESPGGDCCWLDPKVVQLADELWSLPVSVAQVAVPRHKCPHGTGCIQGCDLRKSGLISLCDAEHDVWHAYGRPASGSLFLIDGNNRVLAAGTLAGPGPLLQEAKRLGQAESGKPEQVTRMRIY